MMTGFTPEQIAEMDRLARKITDTGEEITGIGCITRGPYATLPTKRQANPHLLRMIPGCRIEGRA